MSVQNILIKFDADTSDLDPAIDVLEKTGQIDKQTAEQFKKTNQLYKERSKAISEMASNQSKIDKAVDKTTSKIDELSTAMKTADKAFIGKASVEVLKEIEKAVGSTNDEFKQLEQTLAIVKANYDSFNLTPEEFQELDAYIAASEQTLKEFGVETQKVEVKEKKLTTQLRDLREQMALLKITGKENTAEYRAMAASAAQLQDAYEDANREVKNMASDTGTLSGLVDIGGAAIGTFSAMQGAIALWGDENEDLQKTLVKLNGLIAILSGLTQVQNVLQKESAAATLLQTVRQRAYTIVVGQSTGAMRAFRIALAATGIGLFIIALGTLIAYFAQANGQINIYNSESARLAKTKKELDAIQKSYNKELVKEIGEVKTLFSVAKSEVSSKESRKNAIQQINDKYGKYIDNIDDETASLRELEKAEIAVTKAIINRIAIKAQEESITKVAEAIVERQQQTVEKFQKAGKDFNLATLQFLEDNKELQSIVASEIARGSSNDFDRIQDERIRNLKSQYSEFTNEINKILQIANDRVVRIGGENKEGSRSLLDIIKQRQSENNLLNKQLELLIKLGGEFGGITESGSDYNEVLIAAQGSLKYLQNQLSEIQKQLANAAPDDPFFEMWLYEAGQLEKQIDALKLKIDNLGGPVEIDLITNEDDLVTHVKNALQKVREESDEFQSSLLGNNELAGSGAFERLKDKLKTEKDLQLQAEKELQSQLIALREQAISTSFSIFQSFQQRQLIELEKKNKAGIISEKEYEREKAKILRKQALAQRAQAVFEIITNTAVGVSAALKNPLSLPATVPLILSTGALQLSAVIAEPIPQFKKGTKGSKKAPSGFKWVGEDGPELINDGGGYNIFTHEDSMELARLFNEYNISHNFAKPQPLKSSILNVGRMPSLPQDVIQNIYASQGFNIDYEKLAKSIGSNMKFISGELGFLYTQNKLASNRLDKTMKQNNSLLSELTKKKRNAERV